MAADSTSRGGRLGTAFDWGDLYGELRTGLVVDEADLRRALDPANAERTLHWGRNYLYTAPIPTAQGPRLARLAVVKQFRHEGWRERWRRRLRGSKAARSWRTAHALLAAGVGTPEPLAVVESRLPGGPAWYLCDLLADTLELRYFLRALNAGMASATYPQIEASRLVAAVGELAARLHAANIWHRDLTGGNLLARFAGDGTPTLSLLDLNRARLHRRLTFSERMRDLSRFPVLREQDQHTFLTAYFGGAVPSAARRLYLSYHRGFLWKNRLKPRLRGGWKWLRDLIVQRGVHAHIPAAPAGASARDRIVWDALSDQPHQHAGRWQRLGVRLADLPTHLAALGTAALAVPRIRKRYRELHADLHQAPVRFDGIGVAVRPWPGDPPALRAALDDLGVRRVLLRLHPWQDEHRDEESLAHELHAAGYELAFALPQNRDLVRDPERWRAAVSELAERFAPYGKQFQIGQAINRSKWGVWTLREYLGLAASAAEILRRHPGVEVMGPAVIDFEYHQTAAALNARGAAFGFDIVSALLYVDRRGAPENRQMGLDTVDKVLLLKALADTARHAHPRVWLTEVNWPLWEGPHSPAGRTVSVDEESQASYLTRYYLAALATGCVERVYWWQAIARGYGLIAPEAAGLRRRSSFRALATLNATLSGATFLRQEPSPEGAWLYRFERPDGTPLLVGWSLDRPRRVELPGTPIAAFDRDGEIVPAGARSVDLMGKPTYFTLEA